MFWHCLASLCIGHTDWRFSNISSIVNKLKLFLHSNFKILENLEPYLCFILLWFLYLCMCFGREKNYVPEKSVDLFLLAFSCSWFIYQKPWEWW